jgi:hypothetical protein
LDDFVSGRYRDIMATMEVSEEDVRRLRAAIGTIQEILDRNAAADDFATDTVTPEILKVVTGSESPPS